MSSRIHDGGKRLQFGTGSPTPAFRHPYEKYGSRVSIDSFHLASECDPDKGPDSSDPKRTPRKRTFKNGENGRKNGREGLEEKNALICQTFLTENPFFGAYYPAIRPRSPEGLSNKGSDISRSPSTDFDDSKTYKIIYAGDSVCNEDHDSLQGSKSKKTDDIHHFHEHHHFFHDKNGECSNPSYYDKYQYAKGKEQTKTAVIDPSKSFLKQPIQESCMIYQVEEDRNQHLEPREPRKEKSQEGARHLSRSSSKSGKRSSGNETYTVVCEHCQKLLRDHPNARIVGHENIQEKLPGESYDRRGRMPHGYSHDPLPKANWKPTNFFVVEPQHQVQRLNVSQDNSRWRQGERENAGPAGKPFVPFNVGSWPVKSRENVMPKVPSRESSITDSDSRSLIFKCDHCKSIETKSRTRERTKDTTSSGSVEGGGAKSSKIKSASKEGKPQVKGSAATKRSSAVSERKSYEYKGIKSSRTLVKKVSSSRRVSGKVSNQKLSKSYTLSEKNKSTRTSRPSKVMDKRRSSGSRGSKEPNGAEKRSSSYSTTRDTTLASATRSSRYKERRASSEMSKRNGVIGKGLRESSTSGKRISSAIKESSESKPKSSMYKEPSKGKVDSSGKTSRESAPVDKSSVYKRSMTADKKTCSTYSDLEKTCSTITRPSSNRKESKDSTVKRSEKAEPSLKKVEAEKSRTVQTEDRSMQTSSRKLIGADQESAEPKRSSTASKNLGRNPSTKESRKTGTALGTLLNNGSIGPYVKTSTIRGSSKISRKTIVPEESKKSGTAPGSLLNNGSVDPYVKSSITRGSATISRRSVASKESPVIQVETIPEAKQSSRINGIQTEITDLKTQLDRLEALHNIKTEALDSSTNTVREAIDCPKHPIVVCTSTTYIMTKCPNDFGDRKTPAASPPRESEKVPPKEKEPAQKSSGAEEPSVSKCQRFCCSEVNPPQRVGAASAEKTANPRYCLGNDSPLFKAGTSRGNCQFVGARITRAINKVCHCPNRDLLSRYCDTPGRTKSCDRDDTCRRLFGNGKNQRRAWLRRGLLTSYCNARGRKSLRCCPKCYDIAVADVKNSVHRSYSDEVGASERLIPYEYYNKVPRDHDPHTKAQDRDSRKGPKSELSKNDVQIDDASRRGYFLRTSISDICEYKNGSLIRLIGKSGWVVYTKKLFLEGKDTRKCESGEERAKNFDEFAIFPASTSSRSVTNVNNPELTSDVTRESRNLIFLNRRQVWSDSSIYLPLGIRALQLRSIHAETERSTSSVCLSGNVRIKNRGISNFNEIIETRSNFPNELYLLDCKSAADRNATCADTEGNGLTCTCRQKRRKTREDEITVTKITKENVPVIFEGTKPERDGSVEERQSSDVSVKYVFAEKSRVSGSANRVVWSTNGYGPGIKRPYLFGVSKGKKNRRNREHFSMNDKQRKHRWHRSSSQKKKENSYGTNKPEGDSPQNRCACCSCSPNHACSQACEREEEELTGIRKLLRDIGITGLTLGFSRKAPYCRPGFFRTQNTEEGQNGSQNANYYEDLQTEEKGEVEVTEEVKEEVVKDELTNSITYLKKMSTENRCCDCAKQLEQLLNQVELCKPLPVETISLKQESWEEDWNVETRIDSSESTKKEPSFNPDVVDDISLQRRRITECENLLRQFEIQLEDVKRQNEAYICKCEETPRQEVSLKEEESRPVSQGRAKAATSYSVHNDEVELQVLAERKCPVAKDDGYIRFEGKILTQLTNKKSTKSIGCGGVNEGYTTLSSPAQTSRKTCGVKNTAQMTSAIFVRQKNPESEHFIKEINLDEDEVCPGNKKNSEDCVHACCVSAQKIEICCERTMCTCEKCCNIHFVDKHYLPANSFWKWHGHNSENKVEAATYVPRQQKEIFTNTSEQDRFPSKRDECTSIRDLPRSKRTEEMLTAHKPRKEEVTPVAHRPTKKDEGTYTSHRPRKDEGTSTIRRTGKDEATSTVCRAKRDEATSAMCKPRKEGSVGKGRREEVLSHKETPRVKVENVPVKAPSKAVKDEERRPARDEILETERFRSRKESESISQEERFVNQSDLEKTPSETGNESSSKDLSRVSRVKSKAREIICDCSQTSATENCEDNSKCDCASKGIQCADRRKMKRFCECGSKLKLIEDRLRALEERKRKSDSTISSPKERKETTEESSVVSEKVTENTPSESSVISEKEQEVLSEAVSSSKAPEKETSVESSVSYSKEKQLSEQESDASQSDVPSVHVEAERAETEMTESSTLTEESSSLENIESETDTEIKTKVITCHNMNFFDGGDPNVKTKCQCMEDSFCPFKQFHNKQDLASAKNIFFVTNIDLLRQWSGMYGCGEYSYCKHFWNVNESALKPVKLPRDWRNVKTAVASFFRSCKLGKRKFSFKRGKKSDGESSENSAASRSDVGDSGSGDSFLDDCSRSSMPLKRRSFHVLAKGPRPTRPAKEREKTSSDKKKRKRSRKRKMRS